MSMLMPARLNTAIAYLLIIVVFFSCTKNTNSPDTVPVPTSKKDTALLNVSYGTHPRNVYDIYLPASRDTTNTAIILMIHGGAWKAGQKEDLNAYLNMLKAKWPGVALVNMNYRLASNANKTHHNEILADISTAVSHIIENRKKYQVADKMGVVGVSAGAQLSMIYAFKYNNKIKCVGSIFGPTIINDWNWYNSSNPWLGGYVGDVLAEYVGKPWDTTAYKAVSPFWNVSSTTQPTIIFHGNLDPIVPVYQSQWLRSKLNTLGVPNQYHEYVAFHSFDDTQSDDVLTKLAAFFKTYLK